MILPHWASSSSSGRTLWKQNAHGRAGAKAIGIFRHDEKAVGAAMAARSPDPCQGTSATSGVGPAKVHAAGRKRVRPFFVFTSSVRRARAKFGPRALRPASAATTGAAKSRKVTAEETGLPGRPKVSRGQCAGGDARTTAGQEAGVTFAVWEFSPTQLAKDESLPGWMRTPVK